MGKGGGERRTGFAAVLDEGIVWVGGGQGELVGVGEVEVVDAHDEGREAFAVLEGLGEGADEGGLADALEAVEADDEGTRARGVALAVGGELGEDEGDADGGLVVDNAGLEGDVGGAGCRHFWGAFGGCWRRRRIGV